MKLDEWHRAYKRCSYIEVVEREPEEVRLKKEKKKKLKDLKNNYKSTNAIKKHV